VNFSRGEKFTGNFVENFNQNFVKFIHRPEYRTVCKTVEKKLAITLLSDTVRT